MLNFTTDILYTASQVKHDCLENTGWLKQNLTNFDKWILVFDSINLFAFADYIPVNSHMVTKSPHLVQLLHRYDF